MTQSIMLFMLLPLIAVNLVASQSDSELYSIEHSIHSGAFQEVATVSLRTLRQNQNQAQFQTYSELGEGHEADLPKFHVERFATPVETNYIDESTKAEMREALVNSNSSLYRLRLCKKAGTQSDCSAASYTYLRKLFDAQFKIKLTINTGMTNKLTSISIRTVENMKKSLNIADLEHLTLYTVIQSIRPGQMPETESYLEKVKKEVEQKEKAASGGGEYFLQKYWMYIVPVVVIMFLMNLVNPEGGG